jgi:hypothetical protein
VEKIVTRIVTPGNNRGGTAMANKGGICDGATFEEVQALLLKCTCQLRTLMPPGSDTSQLDRIEAEQDFLTWLRQVQAYQQSATDRALRTG